MVHALEMAEDVAQGARNGGGEVGFLAVNQLVTEGAERLEIPLKGAEVQLFPEQSLRPAQFLTNAIKEQAPGLGRPVPVAIEEDRGQVVGGGASPGILEIQHHQAIAPNHQVAHMEIPVGQIASPGFKSRVDISHQAL